MGKRFSRAQRRSRIWVCKSWPFLKAGPLSKSEIAQRLAKTNSKTVLRDISFQLSPGTITGLVGESGSGKTTLAMCLNGLLRPLAKKINVVEYNLIHELKKNERKSLRSSVQLVFQESEDSFDPAWSLKRSIIEPVKLHNLTKTDDSWHYELMRLMERFGLAEQMLDRKPTQVSGGELQRFAIIRALLLKPKVLIADEPFSALDVQAGLQVLAELRKLCLENNTTLLLITHDISLAKAYCDYLFVLLSGTLVESGPAEVVGDSDYHPYTRALIDSVPAWLKPLPQIGDRVSKTGESPCPFLVNCSDMKDQCIDGPIPRVEVSQGHEVRCCMREPAI